MESYTSSSCMMMIDGMFAGDDDNTGAIGPHCRYSYNRFYIRKDSLFESNAML